MKRLLVVLAGLVLLALPAAGQRPFVIEPPPTPIGKHAFTVLRTTAVERLPGGEKITLTLYSGAKVTVPAADLDADLSKGLTVTPAGEVPSSAAPKMPAAMPPAQPPAGPPAQPAPKPATRQQCLAATEKGTRCTRLAEPGRAYCSEHKR